MSGVITDEMRKASNAAVRHELDSIDARDYYGSVEVDQDTDVISDAVLKAIEPMLEKLLQMQSDGSYDIGYAAGRQAEKARRKW